MKRRFQSLDGGASIDVDFTKVDLMRAEDINEELAKFTDNVAFYAKKGASVYVSNAIEGREIDNRQRFSLNGRIYLLTKDKYKLTTRDKETASKIIHYTDGEEAVIKGEKFDEQYELEIKDWDLFRPLDEPKKFVTITKHVYFIAPWGEIILAPKGSKLCIEYLDTFDIFIVTNSLFKVAYQKVGDDFPLKIERRESFDF